MSERYGKGRYKGTRRVFKETPPAALQVLADGLPSPEERVQPMVVPDDDVSPAILEPPRSADTEERPPPTKTGLDQKIEAVRARFEGKMATAEPEPAPEPQSASEPPTADEMTDESAGPKESVPEDDTKVLPVASADPVTPSESPPSPKKLSDFFDDGFEITDLRK